MDWDRGLKGLGYGVKLMSLEPSMTDYLANSAFGRTYANRASRLFQPYLMQDEAEAAVAAGLGPNDKGFAPDLTLTLCEDARDENSGLPPDKGYRLYSANSGTAKFDFEIAPSDVDFVETDNFSEDDPVGPDGPVRLLVLLLVVVVVVLLVVKQRQLLQSLREVKKKKAPSDLLPFL